MSINRPPQGMGSGAGKNVESQVQRLAHNAMSLAAGGIVAQLVFTFVEVLIARKLGAAAYGVFATAFAWTVLMSHVVEVGTATWMIQEGSRQQRRIPKILGSSVSVNLIVFGLCYSLLAIFNIVLPPNPVLAFLLILLPYSLMLSLQAELAAVYSSYQTMHVNAIFQGGAPVVILLIYYLYAANDLSLPNVGVAYVVGSAIVTTAWFIYTLRKIRPRFSIAHIRTTLGSSYQYGLSGILGHVYVQSDIIMLSALAGLHEAGIYAAAYKLVQLVSKVAVLAGRVFAPAIFKASHESDQTFKMFAGMMTRLLGITGLVAGVVTVIIADDLILLLFGDKYAASIPVLRVLGGVMAAKCLMVALQLLLSSIDMNFQRVSILGLTIVAHIGANAILVPKFGALGASGAALFSGILLVALCAWASFRRRRFPYVRWILLPSILAVVATGIALLANVNTIVGTLVSVSAFLLALYATGFVRRAEIMYVIRSVIVKGEK